MGLLRGNAWSLDAGSYMTYRLSAFVAQQALRQEVQLSLGEQDRYGLNRGLGLGNPLPTKNGW